MGLIAIMFGAAMMMCKAIVKIPLILIKNIWILDGILVSFLLVPVLAGYVPEHYKTHPMMSILINLGISAVILLLHWILFQHLIGAILITGAAIYILRKELIFYYGNDMRIYIALAVFFILHVITFIRMKEDKILKNADSGNDSMDYVIDLSKDDI